LSRHPDGSVECAGSHTVWVHESPSKSQRASTARWTHFAGWLSTAKQTSSVQEYASGVHTVRFGLFWCAQTPAEQTSFVHSLPSDVQAVPSGTRFVRHVPLLSQVSGWLQSVFAELPHDVPAGLNEFAGQLVDVPLHVSATSQSPAADRQTKVDGRTASVGHAALVPEQLSATSQAPADARQTVVDDLNASAGHAALVPVQLSARSQVPAAARQTVVDGLKVFVGQLVLVPVHVSARSQSPADDLHTVPALPAACWQVTLVPLQVSVLHGLPSSVQAVPFPLTASAGHVALEPVQFSATSHSPAAARHAVVADLKPSAGQLLLDPSQLSARSQIPAAARHCVPAGTFASLGQAALEPLHVSAASQLPAAARQTVVEDANPSVGQVPLVPVQLSATSHAPATGRHVTVLALKASTHVLAVPEQWSPASLSHAPPWELPVQLVDEDAKPSAGQVPLNPVHISATSHCPAAGRHVTVLALNASTHVLAVPEQWSPASLSHAPPCELPVQLVDEDAKTSAGQAPLAPVHCSATSHWPAEGRQVTVLGAKASTHVLAVPEQWSPASLSHAPPCELPAQLVDDDAKPSAGQVPLTPVHCSATSHWPAEGRQVTMLGAKASTQVSAVPEQ